MTLYDWLNKSYNFYITALVGIVHYLLLVLLVGMTLELKHVALTNLIRV